MIMNDKYNLLSNKKFLLALCLIIIGLIMIIIALGEANSEPVSRDVKAHIKIWEENYQKVSNTIIDISGEVEKTEKCWIKERYDGEVSTKTGVSYFRMKGEKKFFHFILFSYDAKDHLDQIPGGVEWQIKAGERTCLYDGERTFDAMDYQSGEPDKPNRINIYEGIEHWDDNSRVYYFDPLHWAYDFTQFYPPYPVREYDMKVISENEDVNGIPTIHTCRIVDQDSQIDNWIAPDKGYALVKHRYIYKGKLQEKLDIDLKNYQGLWLPCRVDFSSGFDIPDKPRVHNIWEVTGLEINSDLPDDLFTFDVLEAPAKVKKELSENIKTKNQLLNY